MTPEVVLSDDPAGAAAERLAAAAGGQIALAGGSTPKAAYELAAGMGVDWSSTGFWFGDERAVPPDHEHSNYRMAREALLDRIEPGAVRRIKGELGHEEAADDYERELHEAFGGDGVPALDLILLGLGPDAHTASLFPNDAALGERERWAAPVETPGMAPLVSRVTLTLPVVNAAREVLFLVSGEDKAEAVGRAFRGAPDPGAPASLVQPESGSLTLLTDPAAARMLELAR
jgi:6-phosphogluconolactonase